MTPEELVKQFHETYERLAPEFGYRTRTESAVPWAEVPAPNKSLMLAVCATILPEVIRQAENAKLEEAASLVEETDATLIGGGVMTDPKIVIQAYIKLGYEVTRKSKDEIVLAKNIKGAVVEQVIRRDGTRLTRRRR